MQYAHGNTSSVTLRATPSPAGEGWQKFLLPSAHILAPRPPHIYMRACRQCVHESARLFRALCSHAWYYEIAEGAILPTFTLPCAARTCHALLPATNSCTRGMNQCTQCVGWRRRDRGRVFKERGKLSLMTFGTFLHRKVR